MLRCYEALKDNQRRRWKKRHVAKRGVAAIGRQKGLDMVIRHDELR